jgi:hypothetical protein
LVEVKSWANVRALKVVLILFEELSCLKINFHKSINVNVAEPWLHETAVVLNCRHGRLLFVFWDGLLVEILANLVFGIPWWIVSVVDCLVGIAIIFFWRSTDFP